MWPQVCTIRVGETEVHKDLSEAEGRPLSDVHEAPQPDSCVPVHVCRGAGEAPPTSPTSKDAWSHPGSGSVVPAKVPCPALTSRGQ